MTSPFQPENEVRKSHATRVIVATCPTGCPITGSHRPISARCPGRHSCPSASSARLSHPQPPSRKGVGVLFSQQQVHAGGGGKKMARRRGRPFDRNKFLEIVAAKIRTVSAFARRFSGMLWKVLGVASALGRSVPPRDRTPELALSAWGPEGSRRYGTLSAEALADWAEVLPSALLSVYFTRPWPGDASAYFNKLDRSIVWKECS